VLAIASNDMVAVVLGGIPLLILALYAAFLMIVRTVMLGFCVVTAPLCLATAVFDSNNRFFHWWLDLLGSVLLTPLVLGIAISLSLTLAAHIASAAVVGPDPRDGCAVRRAVVRRKDAFTNSRGVDSVTGVRSRGSRPESPRWWRRFTASPRQDSSRRRSVQTATALIPR